jgi:hypothetical protein
MKNGRELGTARPSTRFRAQGLHPKEDTATEYRRFRIARQVKPMFQATYTEKNGREIKWMKAKRNQCLLGGQAPRRKGDTVQPGLNKIDIKRNQTKALPSAFAAA